MLCYNCGSKEVVATIRVVKESLTRDIDTGIKVFMCKKCTEKYLKGEFK